VDEEDLVAEQNNRATSIKWQMTIGSLIPESDIVQFVVEQDLNQPDMAVVVLRNDSQQYTPKCNHGDAFVVKVDDSGPPLFKGEVVGLEPQYKAGGESRLTVRAVSELHRCLRGKKSRTFQDKNDKQIIEEVLGLSADWEGPLITHKHVYQHNQSDLEFARLRAARLGCFLWMEDGKLRVKRPELGKDSGISFAIFNNPNDGDRMKTFMPRTSSVPIVKSVEVRGYNPETKKPIVRRVKVEGSPMGDQSSADASSAVAADETFVVDQPIWSEEEAKALAEARLQEHGLGYITAEAEVMGASRYKPGIVIGVTVNRDKKDKFNGKYFVMGATHRYVHGTPGSPDGGYTTILRLARNAEVK
jgi:phage protein D